MSDEDARQNIAQGMSQGSPHARELGFEMVSAENRVAVMKCPYKDIMIGDPDTGVIAGGVVTALLDHACGSAVHLAMTEFKIIATLDLRIDYMRAAKPRLPLFARAECYKTTRSIAFVRALAYDENPDDPVAAAQAAFMLDSSAGRPFLANLKSGKAK
ncbi:MAG TPA: PaaI family thioesterase [Caulobacter sp.]|nr:PaaI family thioesterase [Caulobacter sp.]